MGIPSSNWIVSFREIEICNNGIDDIEFLFSANPDFPPEPLKSVASGGELSRIMLVISLEISKVFESKIVGGAIPKEYIPGVEKGLNAIKNSGIIAGYPMINFKATLYPRFR